MINQLTALVRRVHFYAGMFVGPFIFVAALTGAFYALAPTAENLMYKDVLKVPSVEQALPLDQQVKAAMDHEKNMTVTQIWPAATPTDSTRVFLKDESASEDTQRAVFVNPATAEVIGEQPLYTSRGELPLRHTIANLHSSLGLGKAGKMYSEVAASWMWFLALGGLFLWWRSAGKKVLRGLKANAGSRKKILSLHGTAGTWMLIGMFMLSATGITWSTYAGGNVGKTVQALGWKAPPISTTIEKTPIDVAQQSTIVLTSAQNDGLTGAIKLTPPKKETQAWQASERWTPWRLKSDTVAVNGATGNIVAEKPFATLPLFSKLTSWGINLHMGILFGLPLQIALFILAIGICAMVVTGYVMWWRRRPTRNGIAGQPGINEPWDWKIWAVCLVLLATLGTFLPLFGVSLAAMIVVDRALAVRSRRFGDTSEARTNPNPLPQTAACVGSDQGEG